MNMSTCALHIFCTYNRQKNVKKGQKSTSLVNSMHYVYSCLSTDYLGEFQVLDGYSKRVRTSDLILRRR